jgi:hypothetical protein
MVPLAAYLKLQNCQFHRKTTVLSLLTSDQEMRCVVGDVDVKLFIFAEDLSGRGPVWLNILWPMYQVYASTFDTTYLPMPHEKPGRHLPRFNRWSEIRRHAPKYRDTVLRELSAVGPNVLVVWASSARHVLWTRALDKVWGEFSHRVLHVCDTMQVDHMPRDLLERFDLVTSFCGDLAEDYKAALGGRTIFWPAHLDTLTYHSVKSYRPIDLIVVGRRNQNLHAPLHQHFNQLDGEHLFLDFVTKTQPDSPGCEEQFRVLMATYAKSSAAFCYDASYVPRFRNRSPLLSRWVHAWAAGCTVFGRKPTGRGTAELMDWHEATIDLPEDSDEAIAVVHEVLKDKEAMAERRLRNVLEAMRRHDTRLRIKTTLNKLGLKTPAALAEQLSQLDALQQSIGKAHGLDASFEMGMTDR